MEGPRLPVTVHGHGRGRFLLVYLIFLVFLSVRYDLV